MERLSSAGPVKIVLEKPYSQSINGNINLNFYSINKDQTGADGAQGDEADPSACAAASPGSSARLGLVSARLGLASAAT